MTQNFFLIGAGAIARQHAATIMTLPHAGLFVADPNAEVLSAFVVEFPEAKTFGDAQSMLASVAANPDDVVIVAVPPWLHEPMTVLGFESGRHVLCEKPLARTMAELTTMLAAGRAANRMLGDCSVRFLGLPQLLRARSLIDSGAIGTPYHATLVNRRTRSRPGIEYQPSSRWFLDKTMSGGGALLDWGVYDLTTLFDVLRPTKANVLSAWTAAPKTAGDPVDVVFDVESHAGAVIALTLQNGSLLILDYERGNGLHGEERSVLGVDGDRGGLSWQWVPPFTDGRLALRRYSDEAGRLVEETETFDVGSAPVWHSRPLLAFLDRIAGRPSVALTETQMAFNFLVISAIYEVSETGNSRSVEASSLIGQTV